MKRYSFYLLALCIVAGLAHSSTFTAAPTAAAAVTVAFDTEATRKMFGHIQAGQSRKLRKLFEKTAKLGKKPDVNAWNVNNASALSSIMAGYRNRAAMIERLDMLNFLLTKGANPRQPNFLQYPGYFPIHKASCNLFGDAVFVETLLEHDSSMVNMQWHPNNSTPLMEAVSTFRPGTTTIDIERAVNIINRLVRYGAKLSLRNNDGQNVHDLAIAGGILRIIEVINDHLFAKKAAQKTAQIEHVLAIKAAMDNPMTCVPLGVATIIQTCCGQDDI